MNLENNNQSSGNRQKRQLKAYDAKKIALASVYFNGDFYKNLSVASHQSHILAQNQSAPRMERENSGFSM
tara:strand:+ start:375 stop:584 length:210 start_codon:yes stop_codon:yes gene_type:complete